MSVQLLQYLPGQHSKNCGGTGSSVTHKLGMGGGVTHTWNSRTLVMAAEVLEILAHIWLHGECEISLEWKWTWLKQNHIYTSKGRSSKHKTNERNLLIYWKFSPFLKSYYCLTTLPLSSLPCLCYCSVERR